MRKTFLKLSSTLVVVGLTVMGSISAQQIKKIDFEEFPTGKLTDHALAKELFQTKKSVAGVEDGRIGIKTVEGRGKVLDLTYPEGTSTTGTSGIQTKIYFDTEKTEYEEIYMSYWVYFPSNIDFRLGGKLPGPGYEMGTSGPHGKRNLSLRLMWRKEGLAECYVHYNHKSDEVDYIASKNWSLIDPYDEPNGAQPDQKRFAKGQWNHVEMRYKLNTPGESDGIMQAWFNGELALDIQDNLYRLAHHADVKMNIIYMSSFYGGSSRPEWYPVKDEHAYFDDFIVSTSRIGYPGGGSYNTPPTVEITSPSIGTTFAEGDNVTIRANANDTDGSVSSVKFYKGSTLLGEDTSEPFSIVWENSVSGTHELTAVAKDNEGATTTSDKITVTVSGGSTIVDVSGVEISNSSLNLNVGNTFDLNETVLPSNASNQAVTWTSSNTSVATVNSSGDVTAVATGAAVITVTTNDGSKTATCSVTVADGGTGGGGCDLGIPGASALSTINTSWENVYVVGAAPNMSTLRRFSIKWNKPNNGLYKFSINFDSNPTYVNLKDTQTNTFASNEPTVKLSGTGIAGFDGEYYVNVKDGDFIMKRKDGSFTLIFSNSLTSPCIDAVAAKSTSAINNSNANTLTVYPNPLMDGQVLHIERTTNEEAVLSIFSVEGKQMTTSLVSDSNIELELNNYEPGMYVVRIIANNKVVNKNFMIR